MKPYVIIGFFVLIILIVVLLYFYFINKTSKIILKSYLGRRYDDNNTLHYFRYTDFDNLIQEKFVFNSNGLELMGFKYQNNSIDCNNEIIVFVHGLGVGHIQYTTEINHFASLGYIVYTFDGQGCNESKGDGINYFTNFIKNADDFLSCDELKDKKVILVGHSLGAHSILAILKNNEDKVKRVVALSPFNDVGSLIRDQIATSVPKLANKISKAIVRIEKRNSSKHYVYLNETLKEISKDVLIVFGDKDNVVNFNNNYLFLKDELKDKDNIHFILSKNRSHRPNLTIKATEYDEYRNKKYYEIVNEKVGDDLVEYYNNLDYQLLVEMDERVMNVIDEFISGDILKEKELVIE